MRPRPSPVLCQALLWPRETAPRTRRPCRVGLRSREWTRRPMDTRSAVLAHCPSAVWLPEHPQPQRGSPRGPSGSCTPDPEERPANPRPPPSAGWVQSARVPAGGSSCRHILGLAVLGGGTAEEGRLRNASSAHRWITNRSFPGVPPATAPISPSRALSFPRRPHSAPQRGEGSFWSLQDKAEVSAAGFGARTDQRSWLRDLQRHRPGARR